jgi:transcription initiation factor TFIIIB Brf1 subunit/transcription initiation factor TFIIB
MSQSPSEEESRGARPLPCPECSSTRGYSRVGKFRVQCLNCNSLIKNKEVDMELPNEEQR